jgi:hypothetical protein
VDTTAPVIVAEATPGENPNGWNNEDVVVALTATDGPNGSGVQDIVTSLSGAQTGGTTTSGGTASETVAAEGTTTVGFFARDQAGNVGAPAALELKIDKTQPAISTDTTPEPNANGWHKTDVAVTFTASDALSGLVSSPANVVVSTEGAEQEVIGTATDRADNQASATAILNIDKTSPAIHGAPTRPANGKGWHNGLVGINWTCSDALSGIAACTPATSYSGPDSAKAILTGSATDEADNSATASVTLRFDATDPTIALGTPRNGAVYLLNQKVLASYRCHDNLSGIASCTSASGSSEVEEDNQGFASDELEKRGFQKGSRPFNHLSRVDTSTVGPNQFRVTAVDIAGNETSTAHAYRVRYGFAGIFGPADKRHIGKVVKAGSTIPLWWILKDARGAFVRDPASFVSLLSAPTPCHAKSEEAIDDEKPETAAATGLRFAGGVWRYNWKTSKEWHGCRIVELRLADGTRHTATFRFR